MIPYSPNDYLIPVSIADLPAHDFSVPPDTLTERVVEELEDRPGLPGVMIIADGQLLGVITRLKLFERLGHRFGVELFLQKPIIQMQDLIRIQSQTLHDYLRIEDAIQYALSRPAPDVYDPIVVLREDGVMQLLDINLLLLAQSRAMASLSNIVGNLKQIDRLINSAHDRREILYKTLQLLRHVVPYHQAGILAIDESGLGVIAQFGYRQALKRADDVLTSAPYALIMKHHQAIYIPNACSGPAWKGMEVLGAPLAWMGVPLLANNRPLGLLSLGRNVERAFSSEERETVLGFAQRITDLLKREQKAAGQPVNLALLQDTPTRQTDLDQAALFTNRTPVMMDR
jgi:hypothetical protein